MRRFMLEQSATETYTAHSGLALIGECLRRSRIAELVKAVPLRHGISHGDLLKSYAGLLSLGKSDFEAVENVREDAFFREALGIERVPSAARLRQRFDADAKALLPLVDEAMVVLLESVRAPVTALGTGHAALDIDVFPMDNSGTKKEGVSRTYQGFDGYAPIAVYLGEEGWCLGCELRPGSQHGQREFGYVLDRVLPRARRLTPRPLLLRVDSGHDALENRARCHEEDVDFVMKWNPRQADPQAWLAYASQEGHWVVWSSPRPGKRVGVFSVYIEQTYRGQTYTFRRVMRLTERTLDRNGQALLLPEVELEGWWTSLELADARVIALYEDHGTSEQFHSEFKTDLDIERLPSGKFDTNDLVLALSALVYNMLRWIGLEGLTGDQGPVRHPAKRRRLRTVMQELMYLAARLTEHGRRLRLRFGRHCPAFEAFRGVYQQLAYG